MGLCILIRISERMAECKGIALTRLKEITWNPGGNSPSTKRDRKGLNIA